MTVKLIGCVVFAEAALCVGAAQVPEVQALDPLPLGSITARGWLKDQLARSRDGMGGHLDELEPQMIATPYTTRETFAGWGADTPGWGAEISGNYWDGLVQLAWTLNDEGLKAKAAKWVEEALRNAETNGYFGTYGPKDNRFEDYNASGNTTGYLAMLRYAEATGRQDVFEAVHKALLWFCDNWSGDRKTRYSGVLITYPMIEVYRKTGDRRLLDFCLDYQRYLEKDDLFRISAKSFSSDDFEYNGNHAVAYANYLAIPAMLYAGTGNRPYLDASVKSYGKLVKNAMHVTGAQSGNDEWLSAPRVIGESEYCGFVSLVNCSARLAAITGDMRFGDQMELTAFNAVQGARKKDERGVQYFSSPNMVYATRTSSHCQNDNLFGPIHFVACCAARSVQVMPEFTRSLAMSDREGNLHLVAYAPCAISWRGLELVSETAYPFRDTVTYVVRGTKPVAFEIVPKKPGWCPSMTVRVNGESGASLKRTWKDGDTLTLKFEMPVRVERFDDHAGIHPLTFRRGPLVYSLPIGEKWKNLGDGKGLAPTPLPKGWAWWSVEPVIDEKPLPQHYERPGYLREMISWNVAFDESRLDVAVEDLPLDGYVWEHPPVRINVKGYKAIYAFPPYPAKTTEFYSPLQTVTRPMPVSLVPFGCTSIRITYFPRCDASKMRPDLAITIPESKKEKTK